MDNITFRLDREDGETVDTSIPIDFSDFTLDETNRVTNIAKGFEADTPPSHFTAACLFVRLARDVELSDEDFTPFVESIGPLLEGSTENLIWERDN